MDMQEMHGYTGSPEFCVIGIGRYLPLQVSRRNWNLSAALGMDGRSNHEVLVPFAGACCYVLLYDRLITSSCHYYDDAPSSLQIVSNSQIEDHYTSLSRTIY